MLSQSVVKSLELAKSKLRDTAHQLANAGSKDQETSDIILCQCGHAQDEGDMVSWAYIVVLLFPINICTGKLCFLWDLATSTLLWLRQCS